MPRKPRPKAPFKKISHGMWNALWQLFCPWTAGCDIAPLKPIKIRTNDYRRMSMVAAFATAATLLTAAPEVMAADFAGEDRIVLASLDNTVPTARNNYPEIFGTTEHRYSDIRPFTKWTGVLSRFKRDFANSLNDPQTQDWMKLLASLKDASNKYKIEAVNDYMNKVKFVPDSKNYGERDYWATPMEFMARGGDCEDYAMAKYISLRALGFGQNEMRLAIVYDRVMRMPHALLIVYDGEEAKVLDNQNPAVMDSAEITRYKPIYSISQVAWWRH